MLQLSRQSDGIMTECIFVTLEVCLITLFWKFLVSVTIFGKGQDSNRRTHGHARHITQTDFSWEVLF